MTGAQMLGLAEGMLEVAGVIISSFAIYFLTINAAGKIADWIQAHFPKR